MKSHFETRFGETPKQAKRILPEEYTSCDTGDRPYSEQKQLLFHVFHALEGLSKPLRLNDI